MFGSYRPTPLLLKGLWFSGWRKGGMKEYERKTGERKGEGEGNEPQ